MKTKHEIIISGEIQKLQDTTEYGSEIEWGGATSNGRSNIVWINVKSPVVNTTWAMFPTTFRVDWATNHFKNLKHGRPLSDRVTLFHTLNWIRPWEAPPPAEPRRNMDRPLDNVLAVYWSSKLWVPGPTTGHLRPNDLRMLPRRPSAALLCPASGRRSRPIQREYLNKTTGNYLMYLIMNISHYMMMRSLALVSICGQVINICDHVINICDHVINICTHVINICDQVVVVVFIFQYGNIHLHTGSIFINKNIFEKKNYLKEVESHTKQIINRTILNAARGESFHLCWPPIQFKLKVILKRKIK